MRLITFTLSKLQSATVPLVIIVSRCCARRKVLIDATFTHDVATLTTTDAASGKQIKNWRRFAVEMSCAQCEWVYAFWRASTMMDYGNPNLRDLIYETALESGLRRREVTDSVKAASCVECVRPPGYSGWYFNDEYRGCA